MMENSTVRRELLGQVLTLIRSGDRRPHTIALAYRIKESPDSQVHLYRRQVDDLTLPNLATIDRWRREIASKVGKEA